MNTESTDQVQGQESTSLEASITLQNQFADTSNIQLQNSAADGITQDCSVDKIQNLTSSLQISDSQQSTTTQASCEAHKSLISNLYNILVRKKLPATDESSNLSMITIKIFSASEIKENEKFDKKIEEFIELLEVLSESCGCDKKNCNKIEKMTRNVQMRVEKIKIDNSRLALLIREDKLEGIAQKYENLKGNEVLMKILFHKSLKSGNLDDLTRIESASFINNEVYNQIKNYQSKNQILIFKDLCDTFEGIIAPKTQELLSFLKSMDKLTFDSLSNTIKSTILKSFIDFQGFYIPIQSNSEFLQYLNPQQIRDIIRQGFTKVSKIEQLNILFYLKRTFILEHMESYVHENPLVATYTYYAERRKMREFIKDNTKNYHNFKEELENAKILILSDVLGSGKTTTLKYLARRFKEDDNNLWISYIDAKLAANIFEKIERNQQWNVEGLAGFLIQILDLTGIEVSIFKQKFMNNQVILLWDHIDDKFQQTLLNFTWNIKQLTTNQQMLATHSRYSQKLTQKFDRTAYKFIPYTTEQIEKFHRRMEDHMNFHVWNWKFFQFCDSIGLGDGHYYYNRDVFIGSNILMYEMILLAFVDLKTDPEDVNLFKLFEKVYKKQLLDKLTEDDEIMLQKCLQARALKGMFEEELTKSLEIVKSHSNTQPPIASLKGIFIVNFDDNSVDFQHKIIEEYFIMKYIVHTVIHVDIKDVTVKEAKKLVTIFAMIYSQDNYKCLMKFINDAFCSRLRSAITTNIFKIVKKAQFWSKVTKLYSPKEIKLIINRDKFDDIEFWANLLKEIQLEKEKHVKAKQDVQQTESDVTKNVKDIRDRPTIKGVTSVKKLTQNNEISYQLNEFLDDLETDESD